MRQRVATEGDVTVPNAKLEDAIRLEMAILDAHAARRRQIVLLCYDPDELLDTTIPVEDLQPVASGVAVQIDATGERSIRRIDDWPLWVN